jgi:aminomethyltransferase
MNSSAYQAIRNQTAWIDLSGRGKFRAAGEDRVRLFHAMCTNHLKQLLPGTGCYAFFLTANGRIIADANIFAMPDYLLIDTEPETRERFQEHIEKFIIADDVTLHDFTDAYATIGVEGPGVEDVLHRCGVPTAQLPYTIAEWSHCEVAHVSYTGGPGYRFFVPVEHKQDLIALLDVPQCDAATADVVRLEYGKPRYGVDFSDTNIPQETPLTDTAVHFNKGCYIGQEIVERVRSRGHVNKLLVHFEMDGPEPPPAQARIQAGDREIGEVTSSAFSPTLNRVVGFAITRAEALTSGTELTAAGHPVLVKSPIS